MSEARELKHEEYKRQSHGEIDVWLARLSHFSQFGLFALTIGTLYFTVIPLYKTAALEESIARRESELNAVNEKLGVASRELEKLKVEVYERNRKELLKGVVSSSAQCSGLLISMEPPGSEGDRKIFDSLLDFDAGKCLLDDFNSRNPAGILSSKDYSYLKGEVDRIAAELSSLQKIAIDNVGAVPNRASLDPSILHPDSLNVEGKAYLTDKLIEAFPKSFDSELVRRTMIARLQTNIFFEFSEAVRVKILALWDLEWPK